VVDRARLAANQNAVRERIAEACRRAGRQPSAVRLVAITKSVSAAVVGALYELGQRDFGENRAQTGVPKAQALAAADARWHFVGHLQRNKVRQVLPAFDAIHSVDSPRLARALGKAVADEGLEREVLIEVKTSGEEASTAPSRRRRRSWPGRSWSSRACACGG
jgi:pyridoxal phosphate enzyme (YggS family)